MKKYTWIFALFCVIALLFAGCGDSGGSSGPGGPAATYSLLGSLADLKLTDNKLELNSGAWSSAFARTIIVDDVVTLEKKQRYKLDVEFTLDRAPEGDGQLEVIFIDDSGTQLTGGLDWEGNPEKNWWFVLSNYYTKNLKGTGPHSLEIMLTVSDTPEPGGGTAGINIGLPADGTGNPGTGGFSATNGPMTVTFTKFDISLRD